MVDANEPEWLQEARATFAAGHARDSNNSYLFWTLDQYITYIRWQRAEAQAIQEFLGTWECVSKPEPPRLQK